MRAKVLKPFLLGVTCGIGISLLSLYTQKPTCLFSSLDTLAEMGRLRRAKTEEEKRERQWLSDAGFSDEEINEAL